MNCSTLEINMQFLKSSEEKLCSHFLLRTSFPSMYPITLKQILISVFCLPGWCTVKSGCIMRFLWSLQTLWIWAWWNVSTSQLIFHTLSMAWILFSAKWKVEHSKVDFVCLWLFYKPCHSIVITSASYYSLAFVFLSKLDQQRLILPFGLATRTMMLQQFVTTEGPGRSSPDPCSLVSAGMESVLFL